MELMDAVELLPLLSMDSIEISELSMRLATHINQETQEETEIATPHVKLLEDHQINGSTTNVEKSKRSLIQTLQAET